MRCTIRYWAPPFLSYIIFLVALLAEANWVVFDLSGAEAELAPGYNREYAFVRFALLFLGEHLNILLMLSL